VQHIAGLVDEFPRAEEGDRLPFEVEVSPLQHEAVPLGIEPVTPLGLSDVVDVDSRPQEAALPCRTRPWR
jgi:hypothetical protein